ncbi:MAG: class I SAM-dependent methyltransferase [Alphaproteobacteria bacterium]
MSMSAATDYTSHWDEKFKSRSWGRWPPEDLVRFMGRNFKNADKSKVRVLEVGCGPGANIWFLQREGFAVSAIDVSPTAIELAGKRLAEENSGSNAQQADLQVGNFQKLPWDDASFDVVIDIFALYANTNEVIASALAEISRVLKPGGLFYTKLWGSNTSGFGDGKQLENSTFDEITSGPCTNMGVSHFFSRDEIEALFGRFFTPLAIDTISRSDVVANQHIEEFHCQFKKA